MTNMILVGLGGFLGAVSRYGLGVFLKNPSWCGGFPISTFLVNVLGSFAIGCLSSLVRGHELGEWVTPFLVIGFLGAFTTFSTFSFEALQLFKQSQYLLLFIQLFGTFSLSILGCAIGLKIGGAA